MSNKQPEALRLADELVETPFQSTRYIAAAELRRLHEVNLELLEALDDLLYQAKFFEHEGGWGFDQAHAAIAKATGRKHE